MDTFFVLAPIVFIILSLLLIVAALKKLHGNQYLSEESKAIWVLIILLIPILGSITSLIMNREPRNE